MGNLWIYWNSEAVEIAPFSYMCEILDIHLTYNYMCKIAPFSSSICPLKTLNYQRAT